jgi:hypothetical protein
MQVIHLQTTPSISIDHFVDFANFLVFQFFVALPNTSVQFKLDVLRQLSSSLNHQKLLSIGVRDRNVDSAVELIRLGSEPSPPLRGTVMSFRLAYCDPGACM